MTDEKKKNFPFAESKMEYKEYEHELSPEERKWIKQFYCEYYNNGLYNHEEPIITDLKLKKEAKRNYNNVSRDALELAGRQETYGNLSEIDKQFLDTASDDWEWRDAFKAGGKELAEKFIYDKTMKELDRSNMDRWPTILTRFHIRLRYLERAIRKERRK